MSSGERVLGADPGAIAITVDTEWAHPLVFADLLDILERYGVTATLFCTDPVEDARGHEIAVHPNFRRGGAMVREILSDPPNEAAMWDDGLLYRAVLAECRKSFPDAIGTRSHSLIYDSALLPELRAAGFRYDSTYMAPLRCVPPFAKEYGILEIPIYYMDHVDLIMRSTGFRLDGLRLEQPGLKVFDFHPNMVFINATSDAQYRDSKSHYHDPEALLSFRSGGRGVRTLLEELLDHIGSRGLPVLTLAAVADQMAGAREGVLAGAALDDRKRGRLVP